MFYLQYKPNRSDCRNRRREFNSSAVRGSHNLLFGSLLPLLHEMSKKADSKTDK